MKEEDDLLSIVAQRVETDVDAVVLSTAILVDEELLVRRDRRVHVSTGIEDPHLGLFPDDDREDDQ